MPEFTGLEEKFSGQFGWAERLKTLPDDHNSSEDCGSWLVFAPFAHPMWSYHMLYVVKLRPIEGAPPLKLHFEGANHEIGSVALNPEYQPYTAETYLLMMRETDREYSPWLTPNDVVEQFECTDDEATHLGVAAAWACVNGFLVPDDDGRSDWLPVLTKTLAHLRGEEHDRTKYSAPNPPY